MKWGRDSATCSQNSQLPRSAPMQTRAVTSGRCLTSPSPLPSSALQACKTLVKQESALQVLVALTCPWPDLRTHWSSLVETAKSELTGSHRKGEKHSR